jgi:hypothetical protein
VGHISIRDWSNLQCVCTATLKFLASARNACCAEPLPMSCPKRLSADQSAASLYRSADGCMAIWRTRPVKPCCRRMRRLPGCFGVRRLSMYYNEHGACRDDHGKRPWALLMLELWLRNRARA